MPKILYFTGGPQPSNYDRQVVASLVGVQYRDVTAIKADDPAEDCDGVAGVHVPDQYSDKPSASAAMTAFRDSQRIDARNLAAAINVTPAVQATIYDDKLLNDEELNEEK